MDLKGSKTEKNLEDAFARESQTRNAYIYYAEAAQREGRAHIADALLEIAQNEGEHARTHFEFLDRIQDTGMNLEAAVRGERFEHSTMYPEFSRMAKEEGFEEIADCFSRIDKVEARHEEIILKLVKSLNGPKTPKERTVGHSAVTLAQLMLPHHANPVGYVHGGEIMKLMDNAAAVVALRHAHANVVTAKVEEINFLKPVRVGDMVQVHALLTFVGRSSMEIRVQVETENLSTEERQEALSAYFIYVALDKTGKSTEVPPLLITTEEGQRFFEEGKTRYEERKKHLDRSL